MAGRHTAAKSRRGKQKADAPVNIWHRRAQPVRFGDFEFRVWVRRPKTKGQKAQVYGFDNVVQALSWTEGHDGLLTGSVTIHRDATDAFRAVVGDFVSVEWSHTGQHQWHTLWVMRLTQPQYQFSNQTHVYQLQDDLQRLQRSKMTFRFKSDRAHPHGWRVDDAIRHVCKRCNVEVGHVPRMSARVRKMTRVNTSPLVVLADLLKRERTQTGKRFFMRWMGGKLAVVPFQRSKYLLLMGSYIIDGTIEEAQTDGFATVLRCVSTKDTGKGKDSKGHKKHKKKKLHTTVRSPAAIARYGTIEKVWHTEADSIAELRRKGKRELARRAKPKEDFSFTHPGMPTLRLGDAVRVTNQEAGLVKQIVYVSEVAHTIQPGDYTMDVTISFDDPFVDKRPDKVRRKQAAAATKRNRKAKPGTATTAKPKTKKASQRS